MKLLIVSPKFHPVIGGGETYVLNSAKQMHAQGAEVHIAAEPHADRNIADYPFVVHEIEGLSDSKLDVINGTANLHRLVEELKPDMIHVHGYFGLIIVGFVNIKNIPVVASVHSTPVWGTRIVGGMDSFETELSFARRVTAMARPGLLTAANEVYADAAIKIADGNVPVAVLPYPVDADYFISGNRAVYRDQFGLKDTDKLILVPSRIIERKGIREAVLAMNDLPEDFYLCLPGAVEPLDANFWKSVTEEPVYSRVKGRILIPKDKVIYDGMPDLYSAADIIAMPSYYEGAPVATVEAMASCKPFVGADSQGINGFIRHEKNGLLVPKKNPKELAQAILKSSKSPEQNEKYTTQARADIEELTWDKQIAVLLNAYKQVADATAESVEDKRTQLA